MDMIKPRLIRYLINQLPPFEVYRITKDADTGKFVISLATKNKEVCTRCLYSVKQTDKSLKCGLSRCYLA